MMYLQEFYVSLLLQINFCIGKMEDEELSKSIDLFKNNNHINLLLQF